MKLKPYPKLPGDKCACGHTREEHAIRENTFRFAPCKHWYRDCPCDKFLDRRHVKISNLDPIVNYIYKQDEWNMTDMRYEKIGSGPTISRRVHLLEILGAVERSGSWPVSCYGVSARCIGYKTNHIVFNKLIQEGIIA